MEDNVLRTFCAERSARAGLISDELSHIDAGTYKPTVDLARYHLNCAVRLTREISEALAKREAAEIKVIAGNVEGAGS